jgi:hypothetical protein
LFICSGSTSSVSSREETVSNVITVTSGLGSSSTQTSEQIVPTSSSSKSFRSRGYKTVTSRLSTAPQGGSSNVGASSPSPSASRSGSRSSIIRRPKLSKASISPESDVDSKATDEIEYQSVTKTLLRTFMTTYTYFTTLFQNGDDTSIKSRTEVITNVVPYVTKTLTPIVPSASPTNSATENEEDDEYEDMSSSIAFKMSNNNKSKAKETTFYTTYTYLSTIFLGKSSTVKTSKQTYTNIVAEDKTLRSGYIEAIAPTKLSGRSAGKKATKSLSVNDIESQERDEDLENVTTFKPQTEYELEGSEDVGVTTNVPQNYEDDDENDVPTNEKTPILKTLFTTFTFYTTRYYNGGSTISSRLETKSQIVTDTNGLLDETEDVTVTDKAALLSTIDPTYPITYFTT